MEREILYHEDFDFGPYALYMAEKYNSPDGYFTHGNHICKKTRKQH